MTTLLDSVRIGGLQLTLRACPGLGGERYAMTFTNRFDPVYTGIIYLSGSREQAEYMFEVKVKGHWRIYNKALEVLA